MLLEKEIDNALKVEFNKNYNKQLIQDYIEGKFQLYKDKFCKLRDASKEHHVRHMLKFFVNPKLVHTEFNVENQAIHCYFLSWDSKVQQYDPVLRENVMGFIFPVDSMYNFDLHVFRLLEYFRLLEN